MKVQLQTNYANRNSVQKTNKAEAFKNPNFSSTFFILDESNKGLNRMLVKGLELVLESFYPETIIKGVREKDSVHLIEAHFPSNKKDEAIAKSIQGALNNESDVTWHMA